MSLRRETRPILARPAAVPRAHRSQCPGNEGNFTFKENELATLEAEQHILENSMLQFVD